VRRKNPVLDLELAPYGMYLHLYNDREKYRQAINALKGARNAVTQERASRADGMCFHHPQGHIWVGVFKKDPSVLIHELSHAVDMITDHVGLPHGTDNGEPRAYLLDYMFSKCSKALWGKKA